jgi:hypothetical protein
MSIENVKEGLELPEQKYDLPVGKQQCRVCGCFSMHECLLRLAVSRAKPCDGHRGTLSCPT